MKYLQRLERDVVRKLVKAIEKLPAEGDIKKLKGKKVKNIFRLRVGKYRIIYALEKESIKIIKIDTHGDVFKLS
jgi:mRNA interferase RelE/StbE